MARFIITYKDITGQEVRSIFDWKGEDQSEAEVRNAFLNKRQGTAEVLSVAPWKKAVKNGMKGKSETRIAITTGREQATPVTPPVEKTPSLLIRGFKFFFDPADKRSPYWKPIIEMIAKQGMNKEELLEVIRAARLSMKGEEWCVKQAEIGWNNFLNPEIHKGYHVSEEDGLMHHTAELSVQQS